MENNLSTPHRILPGVGSGVENSTSIYRSGGQTDGKAEKSPFQRVPLSAMSENRSVLLSGVQRVLVKPKGHDTTPVQQLRSPNNFMKPTESSRVNNSTPVRSRTHNTPPATVTPGYAQPIHSVAADSANIHMHVSPVPHTPVANPLLTPTRAQSAGRATRNHFSPGHVAATPKQENTSSATTSARRVTPSAVQTVGSARKSAPLRETPEASDAHLHEQNTQDTQHTDSAAAQLLFSPDQRRSPARTATNNTTKVNFASPTRALSAPRLRPQSLSAQLAAHSEHLRSVAAEVESSSHTADAVSGIRRSPGGGAQPVSPVPTTTTPSATTATNSGGKTKPPTHTHTTLHTAHTASSAHSTKLVRSADVLSANKAAKKAALALHPTHTMHTAHTAHGAGTNAASSVARYLQPTHSSAAATTALLINTHHNTNTNIANTNNTNATKVHRTRIPRPSAGIAEDTTTATTPNTVTSATPTPTRTSKLAKRPSSNMGSSVAGSGASGGASSGSGIPPIGVLRRKDSAEKLPKHSPNSHTNITKSSDSKAKTLKTSPTGANKPTSGVTKSGLKPKSNATITTDTKYTTNTLTNNNNTSYGNIDTTLNASALLQLLEAHSPNKHITGTSNRVSVGYGDRANMQGLRRSCSFGSELSCVVGEEVLSLGGSIDFSGNNTFESELNLSQRAPTPSPATAVYGSSAAYGNNSSGDGAVGGRASGIVKPALVTRIRTTPATTTTTTNATATNSAPLRLRLLEQDLANLSLVEAPASFSPTNVSMLSTFSQLPLDLPQDTHNNTSSSSMPQYEHNTVATSGGRGAGSEFVPISTAVHSHTNAFSSNTASNTITTNATGLSLRLQRPTDISAQYDAYITNNTTANTTYPNTRLTPVPTELSYIRANSINNLSDNTSTHCSPTHATNKHHAWTDEYTAFFPPEITNNNANNVSSNSDTSYDDSNVNIVNALNYTGVEISRDNSMHSSDSICMDNTIENTSSITYAMSPVPRPQHHSHTTGTSDSAVYDSVYNDMYGVGSITYDTVASQSDVLNVGMMRSTNTINTYNTANTQNTSSTSINNINTHAHTIHATDSASDILHTAALHSHNTNATSISFSTAPVHRVVRQFSDNSAQSCSLSAISPCVTNSSVDIERNIVLSMQGIDHYMHSEAHRDTTHTTHSINLHASADSSATHYTTASHTSHTTSVLDRAMIASYDSEYDPTAYSAYNVYGGVGDSTTSVSPYLSAHPGFDSASGRSFTNNTTCSYTVTPTASGGIGMRTTFFPPPAPPASLHTATTAGVDVFDEEVLGSAVSERVVYDSSVYSDNIPSSAQNSVEWDVLMSVESLPPPPPPMEAYPTHPLHTATTAGNTYHTNAYTHNTNTNTDTNTNINTSKSSTPSCGRYVGEYSPHSELLNLGTSTVLDSEGDSVLQDTCDFEPVSSNNTSSGGNVSSGSNSGNNNNDISSASDNMSSNVDSVGVSPTHTSDTSRTNTTTSSIHPTVLDTSVDLTASNNNTLLKQALPMPAVHTTTASNYLAFEGESFALPMPISAPVDHYTVHSEPTMHSAHTTPATYTTPVYNVPPVLSPSSAALKRQLLEDSARHFDSVRAHTSIANTTDYTNTNTASAVNDMYVRTSYGLSEFAGMPSVGSMRSLSYVHSSGDSAHSNSSGSSASGSVHSVHSMHSTRLTGVSTLPQYVHSAEGEGYESEQELLEISAHLDQYALDDSVEGYSEEYGGEYSAHNEQEDAVNMSLHSVASGVSVASGSRYSMVSSVDNTSVNNSMNNSVLGSGAHTLSCSYTSSMDELHICNPRCRSRRWLADHYPQDAHHHTHTTPAHTAHSAHDTHNTHAIHTTLPPSTPTTTLKSIHPRTPTTNTNTSGGAGIAHSLSTPTRSGSGNRDASNYTNSSMVPVPPRPSVILREELNLDPYSSSEAIVDYSEQSNPDPLARQLLMMDAEMRQLRVQSNMQHMFVPVNALSSSIEF